MRRMDASSVYAVKKLAGMPSCFVEVVEFCDSIADGLVVSPLGAHTVQIARKIVDGILLPRRPLSMFVMQLERQHLHPQHPSCSAFLHNTLSISTKSTFGTAFIILAISVIMSFSCGRLLQSGFCPGCCLRRQPPNGGHELGELRSTRPQSQNWFDQNTAKAHATPDVPNQDNERAEGDVNGGPVSSKPDRNCPSAECRCAHPEIHRTPVPSSITSGKRSQEHKDLAFRPGSTPVYGNQQADDMIGTAVTNPGRNQPGVCSSSANW
jgi:hypothetical protein